MERDLDLLGNTGRTVLTVSGPWLDMPAASTSAPVALSGALRKVVSLFRLAMGQFPVSLTTGMEAMTARPDRLSHPGNGTTRLGAPARSVACGTGGATL
jgi:hypothetical protein